jgi:hypothetical protein
VIPAVNYAVEGEIDAFVARRLLREAGLPPGEEHIARGKSGLDRRLPGFNQAARHSPWLVIRDLDRDASCAPSLLALLLPRPSPGLVLRIAVPEVESWLLADRQRIAGFLGVPVAAIPDDPDGLASPKETVIALARRSRRRQIAQGLVPDPRAGRRVGPLYAALTCGFVERTWSPADAAGGSGSLRRALLSLARLAAAEA